MRIAKRIKSVVLTLDQALGSLRLDDDDTGTRIVGVDLTSDAALAMQALKEAGVNLTVLVPGSFKAAAIKELKPWLPWVDRLASCSVDPTRALQEHKKRKNSGTTVYVAADQTMRAAAAKLRYLSVPHPFQAAQLVAGRAVHFAFLKGLKSQLQGLKGLMPYFSESFGEERTLVLGTVTDEDLRVAGSQQIEFELVPVDLSKDNVALLSVKSGDQFSEKQFGLGRVLASFRSSRLVRLAANETAESLGLVRSHGSVRHLCPSPNLLQRPDTPDDVMRSFQRRMACWPHPKFKIKDHIFKRYGRRFATAACPGGATSFQSDVDRYTGVSNLDSAGSIVSRHIQHPDNARAVQALLKDLRHMGYCAYTHTFYHQGLELRNVIADLPGTGYFKIYPDLLEKIRKLLLKYPFPMPCVPWLRELARLCGRRWINKYVLSEMDTLTLRRWLERCWCLWPWYPWWRMRYPLPGPGAKLVIVGGHLDSSASRTSGYNPATDPAPGADDNASGIAATLALARYFAGYRFQLRHTIRFCFFNAEESGLVGSAAYAQLLKNQSAPIKAVVCADMMGYNSDTANAFELHAGYTDPAVRDQSVPIAELVASWASTLGTLMPAQIYKGTSVGGTDRDLYDDAINRSDHAAFHQQGYPAILASEDFFANPDSEPDADPNPNYHKQSDTFIDPQYAADITCAVALAVKELAGG